MSKPKPRKHTKKRTSRSPLSVRMLILENTLRILSDSQLSTSHPPAPQPNNSTLLAQMLKDAEMRAAAAEKKHGELVRKFVALLSKEQIEHARIAGVLPEDYAIEWIGLCKEKFFSDNQLILQSFKELEGRNPNQQGL